MKTKRKNFVINLEQNLAPPNEIVNDFLQYKEISGSSKFTIDNQRSTLNRFMAIYKNNISTLKDQHESILKHLRNKKNAYFNKDLDALRQFWKYYYDQLESKDNPCDGIQFKSHNSNRAVDINIEIIKRLLKLPNQKQFTGLRDYIFMILMLDTGIRPQEALRLKVKDIGIEEKTIYVREEYAKTRQPRSLPISAQTVSLLKKLISIRHSSWKRDGEVLCTFYGESLTTAYIQERFRQYSKTLSYKVTPYQLRHVFALGFIKNGGDPFTLQRIMGHTRLDQTKAYINLVSVDLVNNHMKSTPLNNFIKEEHRITKIRGAYAKHPHTFQEYI